MRSAHLGVWTFSKGNSLLIQKYFCVVDDYVEKADLSKGYQNPKRKLVGNHAFFRDNSEIRDKICFFPIVITFAKILLY